METNDLVIMGKYGIDKNGIYIFDEGKPTTDDTVYDIENSFIKDLKIMAFLEFVRMSHIHRVVKPYSTVLDVGCGMGHYGYSLYTNRYSTKYVGIDINYSHLLRARNRKWGNSEPIFIIKDVTNGIPFENEVFDNVLIIQVAEHMSPNQFECMLIETNRVLKKGGLLTLTTENNAFTEGGGLNFHIHEYKYDELVERLQKYFIIKNCFGLMYAHNTRELPPCKLKEFLGSRAYKILAGLDYPQESKYMVFDAVKKGD